MTWAGLAGVKRGQNIDHMASGIAALEKMGYKVAEQGTTRGPNTDDFDAPGQQNWWVKVG